MKLLISASILFGLHAASLAAEVVFEQEIRVTAPPAVVWDAITKPDLVRTYHFAPLQKIELKKGGQIVYGTPAKVMISGTITEIEPNVKLAHTFRFGAKPGTSATPAPDTTVTYAIRTEGHSTVLKLTHSGFTAKDQTFTNVTGGWPFILKKLKATLDGAAPK